MAACCTHPLDQTKYRMQVLSTRDSMARTMNIFIRRDGFFSLWSGLSASILRQSTYSTARFALYEYFTSRCSPNGRTSPLVTMLCAGAAGGLAGLIGNPAEIVLVRMCADGAKPVAERYNYRNSIVGLCRVGATEGPAGYTRGLGPNVVRSVLMNVSQIAAYSEAKRYLLASKSFGLEDNTTTHVVASFAAGTVATTVCAPADVIKSRLQSAGAGPRPGIMRFVAEVMSREGPRFLMKGWLPAWCRLAPNTVLTFVFMEKLKSVWRARMEITPIVLPNRV